MDYLASRDRRRDLLEDIVTSIAPPAHTRTTKTTDDWFTPRWLIDRLGPFGLDPCAGLNQPWPCAERQYTIQDDGLAQPWDGFFWLNPPYGRPPIGPGLWLDRGAAEGTGIALVFARVDTKWFRRCIWEKATGVLFLYRRLTFCYPDGTPAKHNSGGPSVLVGYGSLALTRFSHVLDLGQYMRLRPAVRIPPQASVNAATRPARRGSRARPKPSPPKAKSAKKAPSRAECEREIERCKRKSGQFSGMGETYYYWVERLRKALEQVKAFRPLTPPERLGMGESYMKLKEEYEAWIESHRPPQRETTNA